MADKQGIETPAGGSGIDVSPISKQEAGQRQFSDELDKTLDEGSGSGAEENTDEEEHADSTDDGEGNDDEARSEDGSDDADSDGDDADGDQEDSEDEVSDEDSEEPQSKRTQRAKKAIKNLEKKLEGDKEALRELKELKSQIYTSEQFLSHFKTPEEAEALLADIDVLGEGQGIKGIRASLKEIATFDTMAAAGDPAILDQWLKDPEEGGFGTEGFVKLMVPAIDKLKSADPAVWNHKMANVFVATLFQGKIPQVLDSLLENSAVKGNAEAVQSIEAVIKFFNGIGQVAQNAPKQELTEEFKKLEAKKKALDKKETEAASKRRSDRQAPVVVRAIQQVSKGFIKSHKLNESDALQYHTEVEQEFIKLLGKDSRYIEQKNMLVQAGEEDRLFALNNSKIKKLMPAAEQNIQRKYNKFSGQKQSDNDRKKDSGNREAKGGSPSVAQVDKVDESKIDWRPRYSGHNPQDEWLFEGKFFLRGDKKQYQKR